MSLELTRLELTPEDAGRPQFKLQLSVKHNVGALRTTLETTLNATVDRQTGKVSASLLLDELEAANLEEAREKMALWCIRTAAALSSVQRVAADFPLYERKSFELSEQPAWLQREYAVLAERYKKLAEDGATETRSEIRDDLVSQQHPLVYISGAIDQLEMLSYADE